MSMITAAFGSGGSNIRSMGANAIVNHATGGRYIITSVTVWRSGSSLVSINEVTLRLTRLVLGWVTGLGFNSRCRKPISVSLYNQPPRSTQPDRRSVGRPMSTSQRAVMLCGWGVKADMVRVWVAGKNV